MQARLLGAALITGLTASTALGDDERIPFPQDYRATMGNYVSLDRTQNPDQTIRLFAGKDVLNVAKSGEELPYGTVLVAEIYKAKKDEDGNVLVSDLGRRIRGDMAAIAVMQKDQGWGETVSTELRTGDWDFAIFNSVGERLDKDLNACRACHAPLVDSQFLFSLQHMQ